MHSLLATGHLLSVDPDRMVIKRVVLSGHPFKIFTKVAVVRYMFFNRGRCEGWDLTAYVGEGWVYVLRINVSSWSFVFHSKRMCCGLNRWN